MAAPLDSKAWFRGVTREMLEADELRVAIVERNPSALVLDDRALTESIEQTLQARPARAVPEEGLWIFGYGSLPWNPCIDVARQAHARVYGFHRDFCLWDTEGRGGRDRPALTLALAPGGACHGVALQVPPRNLRRELLLLWRREMVTNVYVPRWVRMRCRDRVRHGVAFVVNRAHAAYSGRLPEEEVARLVASGEGPLGSCLEYLERTVAQLDEHGIHDRRLARIHALAARVARSEPQMNTDGHR